MSEEDDFSFPELTEFIEDIKKFVAEVNSRENGLESGTELMPFVELSPDNATAESVARIRNDEAREDDLEVTADRKMNAVLEEFDKEFGGENT